MSLRFKLRLGLLFLLLLSLLAIVTLAIRTSATPIFAVSIAVVLVAAYFATYYILEKTLITRWYDLKSSVSEIQRALLLNLDSTVDEHDDLLMMTASIEQIRVRVEEDQQQLLMMENLADLVSYLDPKGVLYYANHRHKTLLGYEPEALLTNDNPALFFHPDDIEIAFASLFNVVNTLQPERIEVRIRHIEGHYLWFESLYIPLFTTLGKLKGILVSGRDITQRKKMENQLRHLSLYDSLTGIYNRTYFEQEMHRLEKGRNQPFGVISIDVDDLKLYNDGIGHTAGDEVLKTTATLLKKCFREEDIVARIGGDEFAILLPNSDTPVVESAISRIREQIASYNRGSAKLPISLSLGFSVGDKNSTLRQLFEEADTKMYREKIISNKNDSNSTASILMKSLESRHYWSPVGIEYLQSLLLDLARYMQYPREKENELLLFARFHDIGKVGVPDRILFKAGALTDSERIEMEKHCEIGYRIALSALDLVPVADLILHHHEWWNGQGYPNGRKENEIPLACRMLAIVEAYAAMLSYRPYRSSLPQAAAILELRRSAGSQFDPDLVESFINMLKTKKVLVTYQ